MKKSLISVLLVLALASAQAQTLSPDGTLSAVSIALKVVGWIFKDNKKVYYVQVESTADTSEDARHGAYRKAVELAVGAMVVGQLEVLNDQQVKNNIIVYSSGYVEDYKIISETRVGNKTRMVVDVWVSDSKIANYILTMGQSKTEGTVDGAAIKRDWERNQAMAKTEYQRTQDGRKLLKTLLSDYPRVAYHTSIGKTFVERNNRTGPLSLFIPITVKFNREYGDSLGEALEMTRQHRGITRNTPGVTVNRNWGWWRGAYSSNYVTNLFARTFEQPTAMEITFYRADGKVSYRACWDVAKDFAGEFYGYYADNQGVNRGMGFAQEWHFTVDPKATVKQNYVLENKPSWGFSDERFVNWLSTITRVEARVTDAAECKRNES